MAAVLIGIGWLALRPSGPLLAEASFGLDTISPNVGLRVAPSRRKTWFVMYRINGRMRRLTLGTYPTLSLADASKQALRARQEVAQGQDPAQEKREARHAPTIADIA